MKALSVVVVVIAVAFLLLVNQSDQQTPATAPAAAANPVTASPIQYKFVEQLLDQSVLSWKFTARNSSSQPVEQWVRISVQDASGYELDSYVYKVQLNPNATGEFSSRVILSEPVFKRFEKMVLKW